MATFDINAYLNSKLGGSPSEGKIDAILRAKEEKLDGLRKFRDAMALEDPVRLQREQAIRDGRTAEERVQDIGLSLVQGLDGMAKLPAMLYDKTTTGDFYGPETQAISAMSDEREKLKSAYSQAKSQERNAIAQAAGDASRAAGEDLFGKGMLSDAAGVAAEFGVSFWETLKDPGAVPEFIAQQIAQLGVLGKVGKGAELLAQTAAKAAPKLAATKAGKYALENAATASAVTFGAGLQGVDSGSDTMQRLMTLPDAIWAQNPEFIELVKSMEPGAAKQEIASRLAGEATLKAAGASLATSLLPGGNAIEKALVGKQKGSFMSVVPQAFRGEAVQEGLEEGSGAYFANKGVQEVNAAQDALEGVGAAAGQGSFLGGLLGGGVSALKVPGIKIAQGIQEQAQKTEAFLKAAATGDTSAYTDPTKPTYDPSTAIAVLMRNSQQEGTTEEAKQENLQKADQLLAGLEEQRTKVQQQYEAVSPETLAANKQELAAAQVALSKVDPADTATQEQLTNQVQLLSEIIADAEKDPDAVKKDAKRLQDKLSKIDTQINEATTVREQFGALLQPKIDDAQLESDVTLADSAATPEAQSAAERVINLSMAAPERMSAETALQLADNTSNALSTEQRSYLRTFSAARIAENTLKTLGKVSQEVYFGSDKNIGIAQYQKRIGSALASGNQKSATRFLAMMDKFAQDHAEKLSVAKQAMAQGKGTQIIKTDAGWQIADRTYSEKELRSSGGLVMNSPKLVENIAKEAAALQTVTAEMQQAVALRFKLATPVAPSTVPATTAQATPSPVASTVSVAPEVTGEVTSQEVGVESATSTTPLPNNQSVSTAEVEPRPEQSSGLPPATESTSEASTRESQEIEKEISRAEKAYRKYVRKNPRSLWNALKHSLSDSELSDIYGSDWKKRYTMLKGKTSRALSSMVSDGHLDDFLPFNLRSNTGGNETEQEAEEYIKELLRNRNYLTYETQLLLEQVGLTIQELKQELSLQDIKDVVTQTEQELAQAEGVNNEAEANEAPTEEPAGSVDSVAAVEAEQVTDSGKLEVLQDQSPEETPYNERKNLLADFLTQTSNREGDSSKRPLVAVKNFITSLVNKLTKVTDFLQEKDSNLDDKQKAAIYSLYKLFKEWNPVIQRNLVKGYFNKKENRKKENPNFRYQDLMQFLIQGTNETGLDMEENVKIAITYAAINAVVSAADTGQFNSTKTINKMLGRESDTAVSDEERELLADKGLLENLWRNSAGQVAVAALGFKASTDTPVDLIPRLESAFGAHIQKMLMDTGFLVRNIIPAAAIQEILGEDSRLVKNATQDAQDWQMLRLPYDENGNLPEKVKAVIEAQKGSKNVLDKLFSVESSIDFPSLVPIETSQNKADGTNEGIPTNIAATVEGKQKEENFMREDMWNILGDDGGISEDTFAQIAGLEDTDASVMHAAKRKGVKAKNNALMREIQRYKEFVLDYLIPANKDEPFKTPFFYKYSVKRQQRVHIDTSGFNPQQSKIHRQLTFKNSWKTDVALDNNDNKLDMFKLLVSAALGVNLDNDVAENTLAGFDKLFDPSKNESAAGIEKAKTLQNAIKVLQKRMYEGAALTEADQQTLIKGVAVGKEKMHSLAALVDMAHYLQAKETNQKSFTTHIEGEVDGKTNGIILSLLLYGGAVSNEDMKARMRRGGIFFKGDTHTQFNAWKKEGNHDQYQALTRRIVDLASGMARENLQVFGAVYAFTGTLDIAGEIQKAGRDLTKNPLTTLMFGAKLYSAVDKMADKVMDEIYAKITQAVVNKDRGELRQVLNNLNILLAAGESQEINTSLSLEEAMESVLTNEQTKAIKKAFHKTLGAAAKQAISEDFSSYLRNRDLFNAATKLSYDLSNAVISAERDQYIAELINTKLLPVNAAGEPLRALTKEEEAVFNKRVAKLLPRMHTVGSKRDNKITRGILLAKVERKLAANPAYTGRIQFGSIFKDKGTSSVDVRSTEIVSVEPGVGPSSKSVHSLDSSVSHDAALNREVENIHDAHVTGLEGWYETGTKLNEALWNNLQAYSPIGEALGSLQRVLSGIAGFSTENTLSEAALSNIAAVLQDYGQERGFNAFIKELAQAAYVADKMRLEILAEVTSIDQYTLEGGKFEPTDTQREEVVAKIDALTTEVPLEVFEAVDTITGLLGDRLKAHPVRTNKNAASTSFGKLGTPSIQSDFQWTGVLKRRGTLTSKQVVNLLRRKFPDNTVNREILEKVAPLLKDGLEIKYITSKSTEADVLQMPNGPSRGWYVATKEGKQAIYILSDEFADSGVTSELMLHELLHAALAQTINNPSKQAEALVKELESLLVEAKKIVESDASFAQFKPAVSSVDELVSWGMTNQAFQVKVLTRVRMPSKTRSNALISGMKAFMDVVAKLLFRNPSKRQDDGVMVLFQNVSGLLAAAQNQTGTSNINQSMASVVGLTTLDIHQALNDVSVDSAFQEHLSNLLGTIVEKLHGPFGTFEALVKGTQSTKPLDLYAEAKANNLVPFGSSALAAGFRISDQEAFALEQVEVSVRTALEGNEGQTSAAYSELGRLYSETYKRLQGQTLTPEQQTLFDFVFKVEARADKKSDYLSRFAALGLAHQDFNKMLQVSTAIDTRTVGSLPTIAEKMQFIFNKLMNFLNGKLTHTFDGQNADAKLISLVEQLVQIENKKRKTIEANKLRRDSLNSLEVGIRDVTGAARTKLGDLGEKDFFQKSNKEWLKLVGTSMSVVGKDRADELLDAVMQTRDRFFKERQGIIASTISEVRGLPVTFQKLLRARRSLDKQRKSMITSTAKEVMNSFANKGKDLKEADQKAITEVFLHTDLSVLFGKKSMSEIQELISNPVELNKAITALESQLNQFGNAQHYFSRAAKDLGYFMASGKVVNQHLMKNAGNIANLTGTPYFGKLNAAQTTAATEILDQLVSLRSLQYTHQAAKTKASRILANEIARADGGNGVEMVLRMHQRLQKDSKERLFKDSEALMMKGYTPEIYNPNIDIQVVTVDEGIELEKKGYVRGDAVPRDPKDYNQDQKHIYVMRDGGLSPRLSGNISLTSMHTKGTDEYLSPVSIHQAAFAQARDTAIKEMFQANPGYEPNKTNTAYAAPVVNATGKVVAYSYLMKAETKDELLQRDNRFDKVLGTMAGSIMDKESTPVQNAEVVQALKQFYDEDYTKHPHSFVEVSATSPDPEIREIYALLPAATKAEIIKIWGREAMMVRRDVMDINFGYRKISLADVFDIPVTDRTKVEHAFVRFTEYALAAYAGAFVNPKLRYQGKGQVNTQDYMKRAQMVVRRNERIWQEIVHEMKDIIVIKTGTVMIGNVLSNISLLMMNGVPFKDIVKHHRIAIKGAMAYQKDSDELASLKAQLDTGYTQGNAAEIKRQIIRLEDSLARNPVKGLIDAGLMPTIVEDVSTEEDIYSYKSKFTRTLDKYTSKLNSKVLDAGKTVYMTHDTKLYKSLSHVTQLSDFVARYTLYQHLTTKQDPLTAEEAVQESADSFVNYDIPMHRITQYMDDMGIMMFTKYFLRIQRVLLKLAREHPARVLGMVSLNSYFDLMPLVTESSALAHLGNNPLSTGAFGFPGALDELATVNAGLELFK